MRYKCYCLIDCSARVKLIEVKSWKLTIALRLRLADDAEPLTLASRPKKLNRTVNVTERKRVIDLTKELRTLNYVRIFCDALTVT